MSTIEDWMDARRLSKIHRSIATQMGAGHLECRSCGRREDLDAEKVEEYLAKGWPICHGTTMSYEGPTPKGQVQP